MVLASGLPNAIAFKNGKRLAPFSGSMAYVRVFLSFLLAFLIICYVVAGSGKSVLWYVSPHCWFYGIFTLSTSSTIIQDIHHICESGSATCAYFYCDFREIAKQDVRGLLSSLIVQLFSQSNGFSAILSELYLSYDRGSDQPPGNDALMTCLKKMLELPGQGPIYLIIDALDECPESGYPTARRQVLMIVQELIGLNLPHVHVCITSRPEIDIREVLEPLAIHNVPLHEQAGHNQDIADYIMSIVHTDRKMRRWRDEDKELVMDTLTAKAGGM